MKRSGSLNFLDLANWKSTDYGYFYYPAKIKFIEVDSNNSLDDLVKFIMSVDSSHRVGVICDELSEKARAILRSKKISYIVRNQEIKIFEASNDHQKSLFSLEWPASIENRSAKEVSVTNIISPSGLELVDTLLRAPSLLLLDLNPTKFCKKFQLSRPKLSQLMKAFDSNSLVDLKNKLMALDYTWWIKAFDLPVTRRKMTPFKTEKTKRYVSEKAINFLELPILVDILTGLGVDDSVEIGGISFLRYSGVLDTNEIDLLVSKDKKEKIIKELNLRPAKKDELHNICMITSIDNEIKNEKLQGRFESTSRHFSASQINKLNPLRYLWGLNYKESRIKEAREYLLQVYLNEVKKGNY